MNRTLKVISLVLWIVVAIISGFIYGRRSGTPPELAKSESPAGEYTCPMHPFIVKDRPGSCPVCGMELVKKSAGAGFTDKELLNVNHVSLSPAQQVMANLATVAVVMKPLTRDVNCTGVVAYNQELQGKVSAWVAGRLDRLLVNSVGSPVRKGVPVAEIFSIDLYNAEVQYLLAYKTIKILNTSTSVNFPINTQMSMAEANERLRQLGFRDEQFEQLQKSIKPSIRVPIYSPFSGVVSEKLVREGQYVNVGEPLFSIADLSRIWVELEVFESDFPLIKVGQDVTIHSRSYPGETFHGKVKMIYPFLDPKTRTVKIRVELPNPGLKLKPEMYVQANISVRLADSLVVPAGAVMDTGIRQVVWVESRPGVFVPRDVKIGVRSSKEVQILSGLKAGEKVAATGGYLIDSEAQLSRGSAMPAVPPTEAPAHKDGMNMKDMKMQ